METLTHRALVATARAEIRRLKRPVGIRSGTWHDIKDLLMVLAGYLPDVWPSQRTLGETLGCSPMSIGRRVSTATRLGLLTSTPRSTHPTHPGWKLGIEYQLVCLSEGLKADCVRLSTSNGSSNASVTEVVLSLSEKESSPLPSVGVHGSAASRLADEHTQEAGVPRHDPYADDPDPIGADPHAPLPSHAVKPVDPAKTLAVYFDHRWGDRARHSRQFRGSRASERGKAVGYLKGVMLTQVDPDMAKAYIDSFITAVLAGEVELKEEQLPFERFTGWWGRQAVADPVEQEKNRKTLEEMRRRRDDVLKQRLAELDDEAE